MLEELEMAPALGTVLDEDLLGRVRAAGAALPLATRRHRTHEAAVQVVRQRPTDSALDLGEAMLLESFLSMLKLLELHEGEVEVLEQRPVHNIIKD